jgi:hypothetical protein
MIGGYTVLKRSLLGVMLSVDRNRKREPELSGNSFGKEAAGGRNRRWLRKGIPRSGQLSTLLPVLIVNFPSFTTGFFSTKLLIFTR